MAGRCGQEAIGGAVLATTVDLVDTQEGQRLIGELMRQSDILMEMRRELNAVRKERDDLRARLDRIIALAATQAPERKP